MNQKNRLGMNFRIIKGQFHSFAYFFFKTYVMGAH